MLPLLLALLASAPLEAADGPRDWQPIGRAHGVEAYSAQTADGTVHIRFRNTNPHAVSIRVQRTLIWCGSRRRGDGRRVEARIGSFVLAPGQGLARSRWGVRCAMPNYYVEFRGIAIDPVT